MIIRTASFKNLHGHLNPKLSFNPGVNILIGVNGSGKTSILNAMVWTLSPASVQGGVPAAYLLSRLKFEEINIAYTVPTQRKYQRVRARRHEDAITIEVDGIKDTLQIPIVVGQESDPFNDVRPSEDALDIVVRYMEDQRNKAVFRHLNELPGPLYLPLDRRWTEEREVPQRRLRSGLQRHRRSTTAGHLPISEVLALAERSFQQEQRETYRLNQTLRNSFLTSLFEVHEFGEVSRVWTTEELGERRDRVVRALRNLGLADVEKVSERYFSGLEKVVKELGGRTEPEELPSDAQSQMWVEWILKASPVATRIERLISLIEKYDVDRSRITRRSTAFLESVNSFLYDNGKQLTFSEFELAVELQNGEHINSQDLSSGELQLLILFTFLYFQFDDPNQEFAVLVDEPELSLHVAWQNRYVDSVRAANPNAQFIIATHSPEIAGQAEDTIIDVSPRVDTRAEV